MGSAGRAGRGHWGLPEAAARELHEETGLEVEPSSLTVLGVRRYQVDGARGVEFVFHTREVTGTPRPLHKTSDVAWFARVVNALLRDGARVAEQLTDGRAVRALGSGGQSASSAGGMRHGGEDDVR